jgi:RNA polymerase sigma-70 factor (ECF subfamily)
LTDSGLIIRLREGNEDAFRELVKAFSDRIYNTVLGIVRNPQDAEDIAQDVFIQVYRSVNSFEENSALSTWIYRIAVNRSLDFLRTKKRQKRFAFITHIFGNNHESERTAIEFHHPGAALDQKENAAMLFNAIKKLPEKQQAAFILNKTEGLSYNEIAAIMGLTEAAVDALLQRAKQNLRKIIDKKNIR